MNAWITTGIALCSSTVSIGRFTVRHLPCWNGRLTLPGALTTASAAAASLWCWLAVVAWPLFAQQNDAGGDAASGATPRNVALDARESANLVETMAPWRAALIAAEPLVVDPVEARFDDAGRLWVVEMRDYPYRTANEPQGRIRILSDENGDGRFDTARVFADKLEMPTGLALWRDGVIVTRAGELVFLRDTDGDGAADRTEQWLYGFATQNEQLRCNHPRLGPDRWWYIANGLRGGELQLGTHFPNRLNSPITIGRRDVRFEPRTGQVELVTGPAQFGLTFDLFASRLFCSNRNPAVQVVLEQTEIAGNPLSGIVPLTVDVLPPGEQSRVYPLVEAWTTSNLHAGQFTAACGVFVLPARTSSTEQADAVESGRTELGAVPQWIFVCEPTGSLVKRATVYRQPSRLQWIATEKGVEREWLASRDPWFRPVNIDVAPDGSVLVVDMHRAVIEHPQWVPNELKHRPDERWGNDAGRIYVVACQTPVPGAEEGAVAVPGRLPEVLHGTGEQVPDSLKSMLAELRRRPLRERSESELLHLLREDNHWLRKTIQRLLVERDARQLQGALFDLAADPSVPLSSRIVAMETALMLAPSAPVGAADLLQEDQPLELRVATLARIRRNLHRWQSDAGPASTKSASGSTPPGEPASVAMPQRLQVELTRAAGRQGAEQFETLLCLTQLKVREVPVEVVERIGRSGDQWVLAAGAGVFRDRLAEFLWRWWSTLDAQSQADALSPTQLGAIAEALARRAIEGSSSSAKNNMVASYADLMEHVTEKVRADAVTPQQLGIAFVLLRCWLQQAPADARRFSALEALAERAVATATKEPPTVSVNQQLQRLEAIRLLGAVGGPENTAHLRQLLDRSLPHDTWTVVLQSWYTAEPLRCAEYIVERYPKWTPQRQRDAIALLMRRGDTRQRLLDAIDEGAISPRQLGSTTLQQLMKMVDQEAAARLRALIEQLSTSDRDQVLERYRAALQRPGDPHRGREVFAKNCASCHRIGELGHAVGPDISDSRTKTPEQLLQAILDPNAAIDNAYFRYTVLTEDERILEGLVAEETPDTVVLLQQDGRRESLSRADITEMRSTGVSMMPEGLEAQIDIQQMADLIAFIKGWRYLSGAVPIELNR